MSIKIEKVTRFSESLFQDLLPFLSKQADGQMYLMGFARPWVARVYKALSNWAGPELMARALLERVLLKGEGTSLLIARNAEGEVLASLQLIDGSITSNRALNKVMTDVRLTAEERKMLAGLDTLQMEAFMVDQDKVAAGGNIIGLMQAFEKAIAQEVVDRKPSVLFMETVNSSLPMLVKKLSGRERGMGAPVKTYEAEHHRWEYTKPLKVIVSVIDPEVELGFLAEKAKAAKGMSSWLGAR